MQTPCVRVYARACGTGETGSTCRVAEISGALEQRGDWDVECVGQFDESSDRGIAMAALKVCQVASLDGCTLGKILLRPGTLFA